MSAPRAQKATATRSEAETAKALAAKEKREGPDPDERLTMNEIWKAGEGASAREGEANARFLGAEVFFFVSLRYFFRTCSLLVNLRDCSCLV